MSRVAPGARRLAIATIVFGLAGFSILIALGAWQVQRLAWKIAIIDRIGTRLAADPVPVPPEPDPASDQYRRIADSGTILSGELHVYTSAPPRGVGYRVIAPMELGDGRRILLDRGFVPIEEKDQRRPRGEATVQGALLWPNETDGFIAEPDLDKNIWIARDTETMANALDTLPVMLVVSQSADPGAPMPLPVSVNIKNDHLQYAITWFGLALGWAGMTAYALWRIKRRID